MHRNAVDPSKHGPKRDCDCCIVMHENVAADLRFQFGQQRMRINWLRPRLRIPAALDGVFSLDVDRKFIAQQLELLA
jgi:hypothetical protein